MVSLASAGNVYATCLRILRARGYRLRIDAGSYEDDDAGLGYLAERDSYSFAASNPLELLGLTAVYEHVQPTEDAPYWWAVDGPDIQDELLTEALERALADVRRSHPERWMKIIHRALDAAAQDPDTTAADRLGISEAALARALSDPLFGER